MPGQSRICAVDSCVTDYNVLKKFGVTLRFFSFPKDENMRNEWLYRCSRSSDDFTSSDSICSRHFTFSDYDDSIASKITNSKPKRLNPNAVPSLFMEKRPQKAIKRNIIEYHKILAEEILKHEEQEAKNSSEPPIYLEFSQNENREQDPLSLSSVANCESSSQIDSLSEVDSLVKKEDYCSMDLKEELHLFDICNENMAESIKSKISTEGFIGHCYICDKTIGESDLGQVSKEDFKRVVQKVLEGIGTELVVVVKEDDGLCGMCRSLVDRIMKLEADLRTTSLGLRALLRLKYSLPLPSPSPSPLTLGHMVKKEPKVQVTSKQSTSVKGMTAAVVQPTSSSTVVRKKNVFTQTEHSASNFHYCQRHKLIQTPPMEQKKHKKTQTIDDSPVKKEITYVSNVNEVECLEAGETPSSDWRSGCVASVSPGEGLFEDISDAAELTTLNDDFVVEARDVVTETAETTVGSEVVISEPVKTSGSAVVSILKCARCRFRTKSHKKMKEHMFNFLNEEALYCSICEFSFHQVVSYTQHAVTHSETSQKRRCMFCDAEIHDRTHMRFHIEAKHRQNSFSHRCPMCSQVFLFASAMRKHIRSKHNVKNSYKCGKCDKIFNDEIKYNSHIEYHHRDNLNCKFCFKVQPNVEKLILHERSHRFDKGPVYKCSYCPKKFIRRDLLPRHEMRHTGQFPYRCSDCGYGFHEPESLEKHKKGCFILMKTAAGNDTNSRARSEAWNKPRHNSSVCDVCGKVIKTKYKLHREMHDNPTSFQCHKCGKSFRYKINMDIHIKNIHPDAE